MFNPTRQVLHPLWNQLQQFQHDMNSLINRWGEDNPRQAAWSTFPPINVWEVGDSLHLEAEMPGLRLEDLEIFVTGTNQLTLKGERKPVAPEKAVRHRQERGFGKFVRTLTLPFAVDPNNVEAHFENGVLRVQLAKHESAKARKIFVKGE
jgi:HSP20 family protein